MKEDVRQALRDAGFGDHACVPVGLTRWQPLAEDIARRFTTLEDHLLATWWWERLRDPWGAVRPADPLLAVSQLLPEGRVWLLLEARQKRIGSLWVFDADASAVVPLLGHLPACEYYVVDRKLEWLVGENHHGHVFACGEFMVSRLEALV